MKSTAPAVLFVDDGGWDCFFQLAAGIRRRGFRAVRVTLRQPRRVETVGTLAFDRTIVLDHAEEVPSLGRALVGEEIVDVQCVDSVAGTIYANLGVLEGTRAHWMQRAVATDKVATHDLLRAHGVRVPDQAPWSVGVQEAVRRFGLPVVVKARRGSGGTGVRVAWSEARARTARSELGGEGCYERHVAGRPLQFSCLVTETGLRASVAYETVARREPLGPASIIRTNDDDALRAVAVSSIEALGLRGLVNVNVLRDAGGRDWVHDVNPRVWGSWLAFRTMGADFLSAYVDWLRGTARRSAEQRARPNIEARVFPAALGMVLAPRGIRAYLDLARWGRPYTRVLGVRYAALELGRHQRLLLGSDRPPIPYFEPAQPQPGAGGATSS